MMKCEECQNVLEEYFDGELEQLAAARVLQHLDSCAGCARAFQELESEQLAYLNYERDIEVPPSMWAGVRTQLAEEQNAQNSDSWWVGLSRLFSPSLINVPVTVALVLLAVGLTIVVMKVLDRPDANQVVSSSKAVEAPVKSNQSEPEKNIVVNTPEEKVFLPVKDEKRVVRRQRSEPETASQLVREAEQKYLGAIELLTQEVNRRSRSLDHESRERFDGALAAIDQTILATRRAVKRDPGDPVAVDYMLTAYRQKVDVLREMTSY